MKKNSRKKIKKYNNKVSTIYGIILLLVSAFAGGYYIGKINIDYNCSVDDLTQEMMDYSFKNNISIASKNGSLDLSSAKKEDCRNIIYNGNAKINGWYEENGNDWFFRIIDTDLSKLPTNPDNQTRLKIVDSTNELISNLKKSNHNNPEEITITGYAFNCNGAPLVALSYRDGIFKNYLK